MRHPHSCVAVVLLWPGWALAQVAPTPAAPAQATPVELDRVQITGTRAPERARDVPASVSIVERTDGRSDGLGATLSERLATVPGVLARDRHNFAQDEQISIRGFGTRASFGIRGVRLFLDGVPATMPDGQGQVSHMPWAFAQRIEVLRGPFSVLYGNAAGGVIQVFTDAPEGPTGVSATAAVGQAASRRVSIETHGGDDRFGWLAGLQHLATDGTRPHSAAERNTVHAKLRVGEATLVVDTLDAPNAQDPLGLDRAQYLADPDQAAPNALLFNTRKSVAQRQAGVVFEHAFPAGTLRAMTYGGVRDIEQFLAIPPGTQANPLSSGGVVDLHSPYGGVDLRWSQDAMFADAPLQWAFGVAFDAQRQHRRGYENFIGSTLGVRGALRADQVDRVDALDPYAQATWQPGARWSLTAGVRHSRVRFRSDDAFITTRNPDDSGRATYSATSPVFGASWRANDALQLYASFGEGFETATFNELQYRADGGSGLNLALRPARTRSTEFGAKAGRDALRVEWALFRADTSDEITVGTSVGGRTTYQNAGDARRDGMEVSGSMPLGEAWHAEFALALIDARFRDGFLACNATPCVRPTVPVSAGTRIPGVPRTTAQAALRWGDPLAGWHARVEAQYVAAVPVNHFDDERAGSYAVFGASAGYGFGSEGRDGRVFVAVDNLGDKVFTGSVIVNEGNRRYYEPASGRGVTLGVEMHWH